MSHDSPTARQRRRMLGIWVLFVALTSGSLFAQQPQPQPQPLDPLTPQEVSEAERIARGDQRVRDLLGAGGRANYIGFLALKGSDAAAEPQRHAEVLMLRDDAQYGVRALVQLGGKAAVVSVQRVSESDVPMTDIELQSAARVAADNPNVRTAIGAQLAQLQVEGLRIFTNDKSDPCFNQRCVRLMYRQGRDYLSDPVVTVNLSRSTVQVERRKR